MDTKWDIVAPGKVPISGTAAEVLGAALSASRLLPSVLTDATEAGEPVLLCVNDPNRSTLTKPALRALANLVDTIPAAKSDGRTARPPRGPRFRALVATGTHRFSTQQRQAFEEATFTDSGLSIEEVVWHDATDSSALAEVAGVRMHRWVAESRFLLPIGSVEPHYFAGVTGPHKTVTVGCMSRDDIERHHEDALSPSSDLLCLQGNPVFDGTIDILRSLESSGRRICAVGEVVRGDVLIAAAVGAPTDVLDELLPTVRQVYVRRVAKPVDVLRLRVPLPLGGSLYQADKALKNNHLAVRDGGGILLEADCPEGIGPDAFMTLLRRSDDYAAATRSVSEQGYRLGDHKAVKLRYLMDPACRGVRVALVSPHVSTSDLDSTGIEVFPTLDPAMDWLTKTADGPTANGLIIEDAAMLCVTP